MNLYSSSDEAILLRGVTNIARFADQYRFARGGIKEARSGIMFVRADSRGGERCVILAGEAANVPSPSFGTLLAR